MIYDVFFSFFYVHTPKRLQIPFLFVYSWTWMYHDWSQIREVTSQSSFPATVVQKNLTLFGNLMVRESTHDNGEISVSSFYVKLLNPSFWTFGRTVQQINAWDDDSHKWEILNGFFTDQYVQNLHSCIAMSDGIILGFAAKPLLKVPCTVFTFGSATMFYLLVM